MLLWLLARDPPRNRQGSDRACVPPDVTYCEGVRGDLLSSDAVPAPELDSVAHWQLSLAHLHTKVLGLALAAPLWGAHRGTSAHEAADISA